MGEQGEQFGEPAGVGDEAPEVDAAPQLELPPGSEPISVCWDVVSIHVHP